MLTKAVYIWNCSFSLYIILKVKVKVAQLSPTLCDPWTIQFMELSKPEYWSGWPFPSPGDLPNPGIEPRSPTLQADSLQGQKISFQKSLLPTSPFLFMTDHPLNNAYVYLYCSKLSSFKPSVLSLSSELLYVLDLEFPTYPVKKSHFQESSTVNALINNLSY